MLKLPQYRYAMVEGHRVRYWEAGSGPPVLLIHGLGNSALTWRNSIDALAHRFRVLAIDLPGHGLSDMPRIRYRLPEAVRLVTQFMDALGEESAHLVGNSMGGVIALEVALTHPERVRRLVLVDSVGLGKEIAGFLRLGSVPGVGEYFERPNRRRLKRLVSAMVYDPRFIDDEVVEEMYHYRRRQGAPRELLRLLRTGVSIFGQRRSILRLSQLPALRPPLLVLWGREDRVVPVSHALAAAARPPDARLHIFERCGHWPQVEHAEEFNGVVTAFLGDTIPGASSHAPLHDESAVTNWGPRWS